LTTCPSLQTLDSYNMSLIRNTADKIQIQGEKKGTQNTRHNDDSLKLKQTRIHK